jgi:hypothetical protein
MIYMMQTQEAEPQSCLRPRLFMVGQDSHGNWVVQDQSGICGGLFVDRAEALRFARSENGDRQQAVIFVDGVFELDMTRRRSRQDHRQATIDDQASRRAA